MADKILPTLSENIKSGNSLIGKDVVFQGKMKFDNYEEELKINPFDFEPAFPKVFKNGGFDAIVGNPPYVKEYTDREAFETVKIGKLQKYYQGKMDLWYFFACYGIDLLKEKGLLGYIAPNNWVSNAGASIMRNKVIQDSKIIELIDFGSFMVFKDASIQTMVMIFENNKSSDNYNFLYQNFNKTISEIELQKEIIEKAGHNSHILKPTISKIKFTNSFLKFGDSNIEDILDKINLKRNFEIDSNNEITNGIHPHHGYVSKKMSEINPLKYKTGEGIFALKEQELINLLLNENEKKLIKPFYSDASLFSKYFLDTSNNKEYLIYTDSTFKNESKIDNFPNIKLHLDKYKELITSDNKPYGLHRARKEYYFKDDKILSVRKCSEPTFAYTNEDAYMSAMYYIIKSERINLKYLTGLLNSKLVKFWLFNKGKMQGNMFQIDKEPLLQIPIFKTDNKDQEQKMITLVEQMLESKKREKEATSDREKEYIADHIKSLDFQIDNLVYEMYGLSDEEREIVEGRN
jgi:adenine-specific DNA-methyltransferase